MSDRYEEACKLVIESRKASTSWLQRQMRLGYNSAVRLMERMEDDGIVSAPNSNGARTVLAEATGGGE
jgi:S-DNA-T family DNA segregation ATPase FtsK/SpoIIIE